MRGYIYILAPLAAWFFAQGIKFLVSLRKDGISWNDVIQSGGLPSSHSAFIVSITTVIGINEGIKSALFGLSLALTGIILYDALGVRRTTGEQTIAITELAEHSKVNLKTKMHNSQGHNLVEVLMGGLIGLLVGFGLNYLLK